MSADEPESAAYDPSLALVVAVAENGVIGKDGGLPWHLPDELRYFKRLTVGHTLIMGRRTFESIGRPLPRRRTIVLTRDPDFRAEGVDVASGLDRALALCEPGPDGGPSIFAVGGSSVYREALPRAGHLFLTRVHASVDGDVHFPQVDWRRWRCRRAERHEQDARHAHAFTMECWERSPAGDAA